MADAELKVRIDAEIGQGIKNASGSFIDFSRSIGELETKLKAFQNGVKNATNPQSIARLNSAIEVTKGKIADLAKFNQSGGVSLQKFSKGADQAGFALTNLGRLTQDAPFGFIGIQNNIPPLIESFQRLKQTTGTTGGALKALGSSLVGSGGLLFGVSLVTSALTVLAQNPEQVAGALNYLAGVTDKTTESQKKYNEAINESLGSAKVEISNLESLISIARNETLSRNARLEALKKVKAEYPEQLEFLRLENINSKEAAKAIDILSNSLLRKAKIQAVEKLLGEAFVKQLESTTKSAVQQASTLSKVVGAGLGAAGIKNFVVLQNGLENQSKAFKEAGTEINTYSAILKKLNTEEANAGTLFDDKTKKPKKETEFFRGEQFVAKPSQNELDKFLEAYKKTALELNKTPLVPFPQIAEKLTKPVNEWGNYVNETLLPSLQGSFQTFFDDILKNGTFSFQALGKAILNTFTSVLASEAAKGVLSLISGGSSSGNKKSGGGLFSALFSGAGKLLGGKAAAGGTAAAVTGGTAATGGLLLPILGGLAVGGIIASLFKKKPKAPTPAISTTSTTSGSASGVDFGSGTVVFQISGANLIGVLNRAGQKLQRYGG